MMTHSDERTARLESTTSATTRDVVYEDHPQWIACREGLTTAFVDLYRALRENDPLQVEEEWLNVQGFRSSAAFLFGEQVVDLYFAAICDAFSQIAAESHSEPPKTDPQPRAKRRVLRTLESAG